MITDRDAALEFLFGRINYERTMRLPYRSREFKLDRMRQLVHELGDPQLRFPVVHVAGTKGKGSTSAMIASVLTAAGYRTGLYTSPHLDCIEERWQIDGLPCTGEQLVGLIETIRPVVQSLDRSAVSLSGEMAGPTYFEVTTTAALLHFARQQVDVAVLEVGLGGRLDSTNVCCPEVCVITTISFDHTRQLGSTLEAITTEKAGIIKPDVPVVTAVTQPEPWQVIQQTARRLGAPCYQLERDFFLQYRGVRGTHATAETAASDHWHGRMDYWDTQPLGNNRYAAVQVGLPGRHQAENAAVAVATLQSLQRGDWRITESAIRQGLETVRVPARLEVLPGTPSVVVDAAHNVASIQAMLDTLEELFPTIPGRRILIFATSVDKDTRGMLMPLMEHFDTLVFTKYLNNPRFVEPDRLLAIAAEFNSQRQTDSRELFIKPDPASAWSFVTDGCRSDDLVCVAGSFFLAAEMRNVIQPAETLPSVSH